jgi:hypothetical protein
MCHVIITVNHSERVYKFVWKSFWDKKALYNLSVLKSNPLIESTKPLLEFTLPVCVIQGALLPTDYCL